VIGKHDGAVNSIALGLIDGAPIVVSGSSDRTISRWNARTGEPIGHGPTACRCSAIIFDESVITIDLDDNVGVAVGLDRGIVLLELFTTDTTLA
jgi:WD40 repeat protein